MLVLSETTDKIQVVLGGAVTTNQLQCFSSYRDITTSAYAPLRTGINTNDTTDVDIVPSPSTSTQRVVDFISIYNSDTADATVTLKVDLNGTEYILYKETLNPGDTLRYIEGAGFSTERTYQSIKSFTVHGHAGANFVMTNQTLSERFAGNTTRHLFLADLKGYSQVRFQVNKMVVGTATSEFRAKYSPSYNTTVGNFVAITSGTELYVPLNSTGYFDSGWVDMVSGAKNNAVCIGFTEVGGDGVADPALGATNISFR